MIPTKSEPAISHSQVSSLESVGIIAKNSVAFVDAVFTHLQHDLPVIILKGPAHADDTQGFLLTRIVEPADTTGWTRLNFTPRHLDKVAQFAFTSGTEGRPKAIAVSHLNLADMVERLNSVMHMDASIKEYVGVPVYHSFGFGRCRAVATVGGAFYIPPDGFNPLEIQRMLERNEINAISAVPSLWRTLFENKDIFGEETRRVKWIEIGSQYMSAQEKLLLRQIFPEACIVQHYGLTEASRATFLPIHTVDNEQHLESVGAPVGDTEVKITTDGRIAIRGRSVAKRMWRDGQAESLTDSDGWLTTSDLGELKQGQLFYKGRADDVINCGGVKIAPESLEKALLQKLGLRAGIACCRIADERRGDGILVAFLSHLSLDEGAVRQAARDALSQMNINIGAGLTVMSCEQFPTTPTGKIKRKELAQSSELLPSRAPPGAVEFATSSHSRELELIALWKDLLQIDEVGSHENFNDLGGDSLTAITAIVKMRRMGIPEATCRGILQGKTIAQIVAEEEALANRTQAQSPNALDESQRLTLNIKFVRGLLVLLVIFAHWSEGLFNRLPPAMEGLWTSLAPVFSAGTPSFAIMYGVTIGYSFYPTYLKSPSRLRQMRSPILWILGAGVLVIAASKLLEDVLTGGSLNATTIGNSLYGVLSYYLLATLSLPAWFWLLSKSGAPVIAALSGALFLQLFYLQYILPLGVRPAAGLIELIKLLFTAKFSYFNMTSGVMIGVALGIALRSKQFILRRPAAIALGFMAMLGAWWLSALCGETDLWLVWPAHQVQAWKWLGYIGICLWLMAATDRGLNFYHRMPKPAVMPLNLVACAGLLAFPMFVLHELVLPTKNILAALGLPSALALGVPMTLFCVGGGYLFYKSYRMQFD